MKVLLSKLPGKLDYTKVDCECVVVGVSESDAKKLDRKSLAAADNLTDGAVFRFLEKNEKFGKFLEAVSFYISPKQHKKIEKLVLVGLGKTEKLDNYKLRHFFAFVAKSQVKNVTDVAFNLPHAVEISKRVESAVVGFSEGLFNSGHYKSEKNEDGRTKIERLVLFCDTNLSEAQKDANNGLVLGEAIEKTRELVNLPSNTVTPQYMVSQAKKMATANNLKIRVFSEKQVNEMGMGIMASVAKGSDEDLYFVILEYRGSPTGGSKLALVGKGITFDSGGISIKPGEQMDWMKMDMAGAAAVFGAMEAIAKLKPKINIIAACPLAENLPSGKATKPGDVAKGLSGKTAEIINTDAEGRLVLADAISYVQNNYKPEYIVDVATLTGASIVALGNVASAVLGRPKKFIDLICDVSEESGERFWPFPLYDDYREMLKSYIADIANVSAVRGGGTETGAKFIEEFVDPKVNWAHLDIAPTAWEENDKPYATKGATAIPLVTLVNLAISLSGVEN